MLRKLCAFIITLTLVAPASLLAQEEEDDGGPEVFGKQINVSSSFITTTGASSSSTTSSVSGFADEFSSLELRRELLRDRLEHDRAAVAEAVALGAGGALDDLAMIFGLDQQDRGRLGRALRSQRVALLAMLERPAGGLEEADAFMKIVQAAL